MEVGRWRQPNGRSGSASRPQTVIGKRVNLIAVRAISSLNPGSQGTISA